MKRKRILFIGSHRPKRNGSQRFRMEQFFPYLELNGFDCDYSWYMDEADDKIFYSPGRWISKLLIFIKAIRTRIGDVLQAGRYDIIFVQREAFMTGFTGFEKLFSRSKSKLVFDFDDAIWLEEISANNKNLKWLKRPAKIADIIRVADLIFAGNKYLADYALQFNDNVEIVPTVVDTESYLPHKQPHSKSPICIGWSGSKTTIKYFNQVVPALKSIKEKYGKHVCFKLIGDKNFYSEGIEVESMDWEFESEVSELNKIDIGLMPMPDDEWSKGKCGFKAIQYMALEIPPVVSPVGVNIEIVKEGVNGLLAQSEADWMGKISRLIDSQDERKRLGQAARQLIIQSYSVSSQQKRIAKLLNSLA